MVDLLQLTFRKIGCVFDGTFAPSLTGNFTIVLGIVALTLTQYKIKAHHCP
jgi:hypothetical protein